MNCNIKEFKEKYNLREDQVNFNLRDYSAQDGAEILSYIGALRAAASKAGFDYNKPLIEAVNTNRQTLASSVRVVINEANIEEFNNFINNKKLAESVKIEELTDQFDSIEEDGSIDYQMGETLFSLPTNTPGTVKPGTLLQWKDNRLDYKKKLETAKQYYQQQKNWTKVKEINGVLEDIENQINSIDENDIQTVYEGSIEEINTIDKFLNGIDKDVVDAADALTTHKLAERIADLKLFFLGINRDTDFAYRFDEFEDDKKPEYSFYHDFNPALSNADRLELETKVTNLQAKFDRLQNKIIIGIFNNSAFVQNHLASGKWTQNDVDTIHKLLEDKDVNIDKLAKRFLGAGSGGGVLGQLLIEMKEQQLTQERGHTNGRIISLSDNWKKLLGINDSNGVPVTSKLFAKDQFGVRQNKLISKYSDEYIRKIVDVAKERGQFYKNMNGVTYANWQSSVKKNFTMLNPMKLSAIANKYSSHSVHGSYFNYSDQDIVDYENELRASLGNTMFDIEVKNALESIDNYIETYDSGAFSSRQQEFRQNPFRYIQNFESGNYDKADSSTGYYLEPKFNRFVPKTGESKFFNNDFKTVEDGEHGQELMDIYKDSYSLLYEYINPTLKSEGASSGVLDVVDYEDRMEKEMISQLGVFGKITNTIYDSYKAHIDKYFNASAANIDRILKDDTYQKRMQIGGIGYAKREKQILFNLYNNMKLDKLLDLANERGFNMPTVSVDQSDANAVKIFKRDLSNALARYDVNQSASSDLFDSIHKATKLVSDVKARRATLGTLEAMKYYAKTKKGDRNLHELSDFLNIWGDTNILGYEFAKDIDKSGPTEADTKLVKTSLGTKNYTEVEKAARKLLKQEQQNIKSSREYNFTYRGIKYTTSAGIYTKQEGKNKTNLTLQEIDKSFDSYINEEFDKLGTDMTVGSVLLGLMDNMILRFLGISPRGGAKNRIQGMIQSLSVAASEQFGFDTKQYNISRRFLFGTNTAKYFLPGTFSDTQRGLKVQTAKILLENLQLYQNKADELALENKSGFIKAKSWMREKLMDFSINNPEWKNQTEIALSIMQNIMVETNQVDSNGDTIKKPLFNGKDFIYIPGTLDLKPEFDTPNNRAMWVEFKPAENGDKDSILAIGKIKTSIQKTQGNYSNTDVIYHQASVQGKITSMFRRYQFENTAMQYGTQKVDIRTGEIDIQGRKLHLFNHIPTTLFYLSANNFSYAAGIVTSLAVAGISAPALIGIGSLLLPLGMVLARKKIVGKMKLNMNEMLIATDFMKEVLYRSVNTSASVLSYGNVSPLDKSLKKLNNAESAQKRGLTEKERKMLSESAAELSTKVFVYTSMSLAALGMKALYLLVSPPDDDDKKDNWLAQLVNIEGLINAMINDRNNLTNELAKYTNPAQFMKDANSFTFLESLNRTRKFWGEYLPDVVAGDKPADREFAYKLITNVPFSTLPNQASKLLVSKKEGMFIDSRLYEGATWSDKLLLKRGLKGSDSDYKAIVKVERDKLRRKAESHFEDVVKGRLKDRDVSSSELDDEIKKEVDKFMKKTYKGSDSRGKKSARLKGESNQDLYERLDWEKLESELK